MLSSSVQGRVTSILPVLGQVQPASEKKISPTVERRGEQKV